MLFRKHVKHLDYPNSVEEGFVLECLNSFEWHIENSKPKQTVKNWLFVDEKGEIETD